MENDVLNLIHKVVEEIIDYGFFLFSKDETKFIFEKPILKDLIYCRVTLDIKLGWPIVFIHNYNINQRANNSLSIVEGYDIKEAGDFKNLISRLTVALKCIQKV